MKEQSEVNLEVLEQFKKTDAYDMLREYPGAMKEMFASKGWEIWQEIAKTTAKVYEANSIDAPTLQEREMARDYVLAFRYFSRIPFFLDGVETISEGEPAKG